MRGGPTSSARGASPGLAELARVVRRGGTAFVIDNDPTRSTFGSWFRRGYPAPAGTGGRGAVLVDQGLDPGTRSTSGGGSTSRADLEAVVRIELPPAVAEQVLAEHVGHEVDYAVNLWWRPY